jgi:integrase
MSIRWDTRNKRWRFEFDRYLQGRRHRASQLLPRGWSRAQADAYDRTESARLYAVASGIEQADPLIDTAVALYLADKRHLKSYTATAQHLAAVAWAYAGKPMSALPEIARAIATQRLVPATERRGEHLISLGTARNRIACLKAACRHAWKVHALTPADPTTRMQLPAVRNERQVYVRRRGMLQAARACTHPQARAAIRLAFYSGLRLGELLRAEARDGVILLRDTKNGDVRAVPAHPRIRHLLAWLPLTAPKITIQRAWERARAATGLEDVHFHDLRHSAASEMVNAGVDLYTVGAVLGHRDPRSTQRYAHLTAHTLAGAVGKIGQKSPHTGGEKGSSRAA